MDTYHTFETLEQNETEGADYRIRWRIGRSGLAVFSIHGGGIEAGTTQIAEAIAGRQHSFYAFEGLKTAGNQTLHITSTAFDEPSAMAIAAQSNIILSIHGSAGMAPLVQVGGLNGELKHAVLDALRQSGFQTQACDKPPFGGTDPKNICNAGALGMGVQTEISRGLRALMFRDLTPDGRRHRTELCARFTDTVRKAIQPFAALCAGPHSLNDRD